MEEDKYAHFLRHSGEILLVIEVTMYRDIVLHEVKELTRLECTDPNILKRIARLEKSVGNLVDKFPASLHLKRMGDFYIKFLGMPEEGARVLSIALEYSKDAGDKSSQARISIKLAEVITSNVEAFQLLESASQQIGRDSKLLQELGRRYALVGNQNLMRETFNELIEISPDTKDTYTSLATALQILGYHQEAYSYLELSASMQTETEKTIEKWQQSLEE